MNNIFKGLFYLLGIILILILFKYRSKKYSFLKTENIKDYPIRRYKVGSFILILWIIVIIFGIFQELILKEFLNSNLLLIPFVASIIYGLFGGTPTVIKSKNKIILDLDLMNTGSLGMDLFGSWLGEYDEGLIIYNYLIDYDSLRIIEKSKDKIIFSGIEKQEKTPIEVSLKSKKSIDYIYPLLDKFTM